MDEYINPADIIADFIRINNPGTSVYKIVWNNRYPYICAIKNNDITIYTYTGFNKPYKKIKEYNNCKKIFIGKHESSIYNIDKIDPKLGNGNSILLNIKDNEYIYIGEYIGSFISHSEIIKYESPIGNSDVPNPIAIDKNYNMYILTYGSYINKNGILGILTNYKDYKFNNIVDLYENKNINKGKIKVINRSI